MRRQTPTDTKQPNKLSADSETKKGKRTVKAQLIMAISALLLVVVLALSMSVAWFTNVAQTGGLQFQTEAWGFDMDAVKIADPQTAYPVSPGAAGFVPVEIDNSTGADSILTSITIRKNGSETEQNTQAADTVDVEEELRKRIYFYVDTPRIYTFEDGETTQEETVSRVYLGSEETESYQYTVGAGETLTLMEEYYNDAPLKWEWVYDMEGYYFRGTVNTDGVRVEEYLRPVQYDLSQAVFDWEEEENEDAEQTDKTGCLLAIGTQPLAEFLKTVFDTDGYQGTLALTDDGEIDTSACVVIPDEATQQERVYYKVSVDEETGRGVWVYLCNQADMQAAQTFDNTHNTGEEGLTVTVKTTVSTVYAAAESSAAEVSSAEELKAALDEKKDETAIKLANDITLTEPLQISQKRVTIDLNDYALHYAGEEAEYSLFSVSEGADLTLTHGDLYGNGKGGETEGESRSVAVSCVGSRLVLGAVNVNGFDTAVFINDGQSGNSTVKLSGCTLDTSSTAISLCGNGGGTGALSSLTVHNSTVTSGYIGISSQKTDPANGRDWNVRTVLTDSTIKAEKTAFYQPQQQSVTTISRCKLEGDTGMVVKGGTVTAYHSAISGTGERQDAADSAGGWTNTGDGVYVEATCDWSATVILRGTGSTVASQNGYALQLFGAEEKGPGKLLAEGGTFSASQGTGNWNEIGSFLVPD